MPADYSDIDLVYLWLDFGDAWLRTATTEMLRSAQRAMPGINIVQISDNKAKIHPFANASLVFDRDVPKSELAAFKGYAFAQHALQTERLTIFCDVDLIWNNAGAGDYLHNSSDNQISMLVHRNLESAIIPYDPAVFLYWPQCYDFWAEYQMMCDSCKPGFREWWGDQLAFSAILGHHSLHDAHCGTSRDARIELLEESVACQVPVEQPTSSLASWATHFAAHREWLVPYARLLDGGAPFKELEPGLDEINHDEINAEDRARDDRGYLADA